VADLILKPFLDQEFDAAEYLNGTLPTLSIASQGSRTSSTNATNLADLSSQTQTLLSQLNAQASRLTTVLTQLTDDIIRSGSRLAYEVDVLRGEALGLSEVVNDGLKDEISLFAKLSIPEDEAADLSAEDKPKDEAATDEPQYISQLRMLTKVRQRLDSVIKIFGEAMQWMLPPSEVSITSSFISVSAPDSGPDSQSREQKGKEFAERLRTEMADVVLGAEDPKAGLAAAQARIDALRDLTQVWKGTAEEKARIRFVEGLTKLAEERIKELERGNYRMTSPRKGGGVKDTKAARHEQAGGFLENLHKLQQSA
jgi:hypothetical protein